MSLNTNPPKGLDSSVPICSVHFPDPASADDIIAKVHHFIKYRHILTHADCNSNLISSVNKLTFNLLHGDEHHISNGFPQLHELETTFGGSVSLHFKFNKMTHEVSILVREGPIIKKLNYWLQNELAGQLAKVNGMAELVGTGPIEQWEGFLGNTNDPIFDYIVAFGTDKNAYPSFIFKLGAEGDGQAESTIGQLMATIPVRTVVRIRCAQLPQNWQAGECMDMIDDKSTVSIWRYSKDRRQAYIVHGPEPLSTADGRIPLWLDDFLTDDTGIPEDCKRPYRAQKAYETPNMQISYAALSNAIKETAAAYRKVPVAKPAAADSKFATLARPKHSPFIRGPKKPAARGFSTTARPALLAVPVAAARPGGSLPRCGAGPAFLVRKMGAFGRLFCK